MALLSSSRFKERTRNFRTARGPRRRPGGTERQSQTLDLGSAADFGARIRTKFVNASLTAAYTSARTCNG